MDPPLQFQGESNHHANSEMIDMAGVLSLDKGCAPENLAEIGRIFHSLADGWRSDVDVIAAGGLRLWPIRPTKPRSF
jgi:hypothetical protein